MSRGSLKQGQFTPKNPKKYVGKVDAIVFRSSWELRFMRYCDDNPAIVLWTSEEVVIPYFSAVDHKNHRYFVDFMIRVVKPDGTDRKYLIEIKPHEQTMPPTKPRSKHYKAQVETYVTNQEKWRAAAAWCKKNGAEFAIMTEYDLGLAKRKN